MYIAVSSIQCSFEKNVDEKICIIWDVILTVTIVVVDLVCQMLIFISIKHTNDVGNYKCTYVIIILFDANKF
jgi:hypothetical protein